MNHSDDALLLITFLASGHSHTPNKKRTTQPVFLCLLPSENVRLTSRIHEFNPAEKEMNDFVDI
jgi:hypothetical protein